MRRFRYTGGLGKAFDMVNTNRSRGGSWSRLSKQLRNNQPQCVKCGSIVNLEVDHIMPLEHGGSNDIRNLRVLCRECHHERHRNAQ